MTHSAITVRQATADDLDSVQAIVQDVVREMNAGGNFQWDDTYPDTSRFQRDIESVALYVAIAGGAIVGFVTLDQDEPEEYQPLPWADSTTALVIHRFAVAYRSRGIGAASALEAFACRLAQERGLRYIKTDTYSLNAGMQAFLTKNGYRQVGEMAYRGKPLPFVCYEKRA